MEFNSRLNVVNGMTHNGRSRARQCGGGVPLSMRSTCVVPRANLYARVDQQSWSFSFLLFSAVLSNSVIGGVSASDPQV